MLHALGLSAGVVVAVALEQVYDTPYCKACAERDHESLKDVYRGVEKFHKRLLYRNRKYTEEITSVTQNRNDTVPASPFII